MDICSTKRQRTIFKNCLSELFLKTITKQGLHHIICLLSDKIANMRPY